MMEYGTRPVDYGARPVQSLHGTSPLDTLVRRTSSRRGRVEPLNDTGKLMSAAVPLDQSFQTLQVATPPKQLQGKGRPPSSPLLHTRFQRTSTGTTSSYNTFNASFDRSIGDERLRDDESVYSTQASPPAHRQLYPNPWDGGLRASEYEPARASDDADRGEYYSGVPSMMEYRESWQSDGTVRHQPEDIATATGPSHGLWTQGRPRRSSDSQHIDPFVFETRSTDRQQDQTLAGAAVPTVVISFEPDPAAAHDSPFPSPSSMGSASSRAGRVPSAVALSGDTNFSRPRRPKDVPSDAETKRAVIERNSHRTHAGASLRMAATSTYSPSLASSATSLASHSNTSLASRSHSERPEIPRSLSTRSISPSPTGSAFPSRPSSPLRSQPPAAPPPTASLPPPPGQSQSQIITTTPHQPPPIPPASPSSLYSGYSFYQLDSRTPSPTPSTLQVPGLPPTPTLPSPPTPTPAAPPPTADDDLQLGIKHHEANRLPESAACFERAATAGSGVGMLMWGLALRHGWGCAADEARAFGWLRRAAERAVGDLERARQAGRAADAVRSELVLAIYEVGQCFFQGWGVKKDAKMAVSYFRVAADLGDADAQQELAFCLANGKGCKKDRKEAAKWYRAAVKQGASDVGLAWIYKEKFQ